MNTFYHSGKLGDIIYSLPTIHALGGGSLILNYWEQSPEYLAIAPLLFQQGIEDVRPLYPPHGPERENFVDLSRFRLHPQSGKIHIVNAHLHMANAGKHAYPFPQPWLKVPEKAPYMSYIPGMDFRIANRVTNEPYAIVSVTSRYRDNCFSWSGELNKLRRLLGDNFIKNIYFMGNRNEYQASLFHYEGKRTGGLFPVRFLETANLAQAAYFIFHAKYFSSNQNSLLAIRQGFGLPYRFEQSPNHNDVNQYSSIETVLNPRSRKLHLFLSTVKKIIQ